MKSNKKKYILLIPLIALVIYFAYKNSYVEFEPTVFENNSYKKIEVNDAFYRNLEVVLNYNQEDHRINGQRKVMVKRKIIWDNEKLFNYTNKALDTAWINSHRVMK